MTKARDIMRKNLRRLRYKKELPISEMARILGVEANHVYRIERGESMLVPENIDKLCATLNVDPVYFLTDHEKYESNAAEQYLKDNLPEDYYPDIPEILMVRELPKRAKDGVVDFIKFQLAKTKS